MGAINFNDVYADAYVRKSVEVATEQQIRKFPSLASYADDIKQELWIYIADAVAQFDASRKCSLRTFLWRVIENRIVTIRNSFLPPDANVLSIDAGEEEFPLYARDKVRLAELRMDLAVVMNRLTPTQRQICQWIMDGVSMKGIARMMKIPYSSLFHFYIDDIRTEFQKEKMEKYLNFY